MSELTCALCGTPIDRAFAYSKRCNQCWSAEAQMPSIAKNEGLRAEMIDMLKLEALKPHEQEDVTLVHALAILQEDVRRKASQIDELERRLRVRTRQTQAAVEDADEYIKDARQLEWDLDEAREIARFQHKRMPEHRRGAKWHQHQAIIDEWPKKEEEPSCPE